MKVYETVVLYHCSPAPPHPDPGTVVNAICPPTWIDAASFVVLVVTVLFVVWALRYLPGMAGRRAR